MQDRGPLGGLYLDRSTSEDLLRISDAMIGEKVGTGSGPGSDCKVHGQVPSRSRCVGKLCIGRMSSLCIDGHQEREREEGF